MDVAPCAATQGPWLRAGEGCRDEAQGYTFFLGV